ncbi:hypothetical protein [Lysinibacillus agricola]|uniref:hypothetical protein n=1 Tax=Lysinibacillus agricola TaxID=2590012 RepID=UPI003C16CFAC
MGYFSKGLILAFTFIVTFSLVGYAENNKDSKGEDNEGTVVYHIKYDYNEIYELLTISRDEYNENWKKGLSIAEMAEKNGIARNDVVEYFITFHYEEMQKWRQKGAMSEFDYFDLVYRLADEITWFIDRNPNR